MTRPDKTGPDTTRPDPTDVLDAARLHFGVYLREQIGRLRVVWGGGFDCLPLCVGVEELFRDLFLDRERSGASLALLLALIAYSGDAAGVVQQCADALWRENVSGEVDRDGMAHFAKYGRVRTSGVRFMSAERIMLIRRRGTPNTGTCSSGMKTRRETSVLRMPGVMSAAVPMADLIAIAGTAHANSRATPCPRTSRHETRRADRA